MARIFALPGSQIRISKLGAVEAQAVFALKYRAHMIDRRTAGILRASLMLDIAAGKIQLSQVTDEHFSSAESLIGRYAFSYRLRTLDALQLSVAVDLRKFGLLDQFVVADKALAEVAVLEGLPVINPEL